MREIKFRGYMNKGLPNPFMYYFELVTYDSENMPLNDAVIMQYTGLKDKNGKEIYEGDILDAGDRIVEVVWHQLAGQWDTNFIRYNAKLRRNGLQNTEWRYRTEIIGNIYENPELLKS